MLFDILINCILFDDMNNHTNSETRLQEHGRPYKHRRRLPFKMISLL